MSQDERDIIRGLELDVRILARELYASPDALGGDCALRTVDRMMADLGRLREQLAGPQASGAGQ